MSCLQSTSSLLVEEDLVEKYNLIKHLKIEFGKNILFSFSSFLQWAYIVMDKSYNSYNQVIVPTINLLYIYTISIIGKNLIDIYKDSGLSILIFQHIKESQR